MVFDTAYDRRLAGPVLAKQRVEPRPVTVFDCANRDHRRSHSARVYSTSNPQRMKLRSEALIAAAVARIKRAPSSRARAMRSRIIAICQPRARNAGIVDPAKKPAHPSLRSIAAVATIVPPTQACVG